MIPPAAGHKRPTDLLIIILLAANLAAGLLTFRDYGVSWDEPLYYAYGENVPYAYSIEDRLNGTFEIQRSFEPSVEDHKRYGPAYLLAGRPLAQLIAGLFGVVKSDGWHLVNFMTFQVSVWLVYRLARRWVSPWAAFGSAALFSTQPMLWGHSFINPKDIPFTTVMLAALVAGLSLVDRIAATTPQPSNPEPGLAPDRRESRWQHGRRLFLGFALALIVLGLLAFLFERTIQQAAAGLVSASYHAPPTSLPGALFNKLAANAGQVGLEAYQVKAAVLVNRGRWLFTGLGLAILPLFLWLQLAPCSARRVLAKLAITFAPLPSRPIWRVHGTVLRPLVLLLMLAGALLGIAITLRIIAPLAGLLVLLYFCLKSERRSIFPIMIYALAATAFMLALYPYLWADPLANFIDVIGHMADNPAPVPVVFNGVTYSSLNLPVSYLPVMLALTLSEPVWPLFFWGLAFAMNGIARRRVEWRSLVAVLMLFLLPLAYVLMRSPAMYDGSRHFLFCLPPVFVLSGFAFQALLDLLKRRWHYMLALALLLSPGIAGIISAHPYEYAYYNAMVGGTGGAFRRYDTDYWLTCYRSAVSQVKAGEKGPVKLYVLRQPRAAQEYARPGVEVLQYEPDETVLETGSLVLLTTRTDVDLRYLTGLPEVYRVEHNGALFCVVRRVHGGEK